MKIKLVTPRSSVKRTGNRCTSWQWREILESLGHEVFVEENGEGGAGCDLLIALHASRSCEAVCQFRETNPGGRLIVALTGTDIYPEPGPRALKSIELADRIVVLQPKAIAQIPSADAPKARVVFQSAKVIGEPDFDDEHIDVCVVGHLRDVKDPLRAAAASRQLPADSRIRILQAGGIHEAKYRDLVELEIRENPRFEWLGELGGKEVADLIASSRVLVVSSRFEGGARVVGEAIVHGTPVLASRIDGVVGLLGSQYPGYFEAGDTAELRQLLIRFETDSGFSSELKRITKELAPRFDPEIERAAWKQLIDEL